MRHYNPHLLPKVRSKRIMDAFSDMPCTLRIASFIPGFRCAHHSTVVGCHVGKLGKGTSTKASDFEAVAGCLHCHDLLDGRDNRLHKIMEQNPVALMERIISAGAETRAMLVERGLIKIPYSKLV